MKFVKENMTLVVVGVIILLAIVSVFYPTGSLKADLQERMKQRLGVKSSIQSLANTEIKIPGADKDYKGVPSPEMIEAKKKSIEHMKAQSEKVVEVGAKQNRVGRVTDDGTPLFMGQPQPGYLPKNSSGAPMAFKDVYATLLPSWNVALTGTDKMPGIPPSEMETRTGFENMKKEEEARRPASMQAPTGVDDQRRYEEYKRNQVLTRASTLHMYVDAGAFQQRGWLQADSPPNEQNIFESMVDSWLEGDVIKAIAITNDEAFKKANGQKNAGTAAIKRLMRISVGQDSLGTRLGSFDNQTTALQGQNVIGQGGTTPPTNLFYIQAGSTTDAAQAAASGAQPNTIDLEKRLMTGRASGSEYDVILMQICLDIDPSWLNRFIDELYRQNMGYTVLNIKLKTVDPLSRSSNGWVYGDTQVVEVEILLESLMFREWMRPLMPEKIRASLGLPLEEPAKAAQ